MIRNIKYLIFRIKIIDVSEKKKSKQYRKFCRNNEQELPRITQRPNPLGWKLLLLSKAIKLKVRKYYEIKNIKKEDILKYSE